MPVLRLKPFCTDYIWGGNKLRTDYGIESDLDIIAEAWVLSCHKNGMSVIDNDKYKGMTLAQYIEIEGPDVLGSNYEGYAEFPILTKLIDAKENLSIQVHPDNTYAMENEGSFGKSEMWYIVEAEPDAIIYYGVSRVVSEEEFCKRIEDGTLTDILNAVPVKKGDSFYIPAGTLHAICKGVVIAEVQQNSNITYRVYDYGRKDQEGNKRELHVDRAIEVARRIPNYSKDFSDGHLLRCPFFTADILHGDNEDEVSSLSFVSLIVLSGQGQIEYVDGCGIMQRLSIKKGESLFIPASSGTYQIKSDLNNPLEILKTQIGRV